MEPCRIVLENPVVEIASRHPHFFQVFGQRAAAQVHDRGFGRGHAHQLFQRMERERNIGYALCKSVFADHLHDLADRFGVGFGRSVGLDLQYQFEFRFPGGLQVLFQRGDFLAVRQFERRQYGRGIFLHLIAAVFVVVVDYQFAVRSHPDIELRTVGAQFVGV